jgi:hypothetical protein
MTRPTRQFQINSEFKGYRHREDVTNLPPGIMIPGSQNVLTNEAERVAIRKGYTLDGQANATIASIVSAYDWQTHLGYERNLRAYTTNLEYRYVAADGTVTWRTLLSSTASPNFNFTTFWDDTELIDVLLFVNGQSEINEWNGAITTVASNTAVTLTKQGTTTWAQEGFYTAGTRSVVINGVTYTYTGGETTTTLTGLAGLPAITAGTVVHQSVRTTANSAMTGMNATFSNDLIATRLNHVYIGSLESAQVYLSIINDYTDYSFSTPRLVGEGGLFVLDGIAVGFINQDDSMYVSAGKNLWYKSLFTQTTNSVPDGAGGTISITYEAFSFQPLKTTILQAAQSQAYITKIKNNIAFVSNEPTMDFLGKTMVQDGVQTSFLNDPTITNISDPIKDDFDSYDFTDGSIIYYRYFTYVAVPREGLVRVFNHSKEYWEAPLILPVSRFAIIDGELYGHSYQVPETYKMFEGYNDNGNPIHAVASFSYQNFGSRCNLKNWNEFYTEGYISSNTTLNVKLQLDLDGCGTPLMYQIDGDDSQYVCLPKSGGSLGKNSLGKRSLAGRGKDSTVDILPPKFRHKRTNKQIDFFEMNVTYSSNDVDQRWELLAFGPKVIMSDNDSVLIKV